MGASNSKIEDDKALLLCQERRRFVRQALDGRCTLADAHFSYIQSLRNTGTALRKFVEPEVSTESSLYTSTSATPEPLGLTDKSISNLSPSVSQHVDTSDSFSPIPSPIASGQFHTNHMKAFRSSSTTVEEKPPVTVTATLRTSSNPPRHRGSELDENLSSDAPPPPPGTPPWDYFGIFHPIDNQFSLNDGKGFNHGLDDVDEIGRLREEEGIPELEEEGEKAFTDGTDDFADSGDDFDKPSAEPLVRMFKNRNVVLDHHVTNDSSSVPSVESFNSKSETQNEDRKVLGNGTLEADGPLEKMITKVIPPPVALPTDYKLKEAGSEIKQGVKEFFLCVKEIESQFVRASESGIEVPRMLEASKVHLRPLFIEDRANQAKIPNFLALCFGCCEEESPHPQAQVPATNEIKYLTWHGSVSSLSSSSRNPIGASSRDNVEDFTDEPLTGICMNSGSHASTLDRLYAWERKLCDEVKASGTIRREYDWKRKLLRQQESRGEDQYRIDKTRAGVKIDKTRAAVKDLHSRIQVAIQRIGSISKRIEEIRDKELQPQLEELIGGLSRMWAVMLDCHKRQYSIISIACNNGSTKVSIRSDSHRQATMLLDFELNSLSSNLTKWISSQKSYLQNINGWLLKCVFPLTNKSSRRRSSVPFSPRKSIAPPIFVTCRDWLKLLDELPTKEVTDAIKDLAAVTTHSLPHHEKGHSNSNLSFSLSRREGKTDELQENFHRNEFPVDLNLNYDKLQSSLTVFLDRLKSLAESSIEKYEALQKAIDSSRVDYENGYRT
ncbi:uncharacterized protein [Typha angustifolia]|uniref:uncharacterized protein n=1 Tax=Typha angustifolia TaxID=59011 RepID=UPI003C2CC1C1